MFIVWYWTHYWYNVPKVSPGESSWDYLLFAQSYPFTWCVRNEVYIHGKVCHYAKDPRAWTVHGIWPTRNKTRGPVFCPGNNFNATALNTIKADLDDQWPAISSAEDGLKFWEYEWQKHGTCALGVPAVSDSELSYFQRTLDWNRQYNLTKALTAASITPSNQVTYLRQQFLDAIKSAWKTTPLLMCYNYTDLGVFLIQDIRLCVSTELKLMNCTDLVAHNHYCPTEGILYAENLSFRDKPKH